MSLGTAISRRLGDNAVTTPPVRIRSIKLPRTNSPRGWNLARASSPKPRRRANFDDSRSTAPGQTRSQHYLLAGLHLVEIAASLAETARRLAKLNLCQPSPATSLPGHSQLFKNHGHVRGGASHTPAGDLVREITRSTASACEVDYSIALLSWSDTVSERYCPSTVLPNFHDRLTSNFSVSRFPLQLLLVVARSEILVGCLSCAGSTL